MSEKTIILYSGKLWYSDKPFPKTSPDQKSWYHSAYEVINPEKLEFDSSILALSTRVRYGRVVESGNPKGFIAYEDGDQITLPEGYGIEKQNACASDVCDTDGQCEHCREPKSIATITVPEKTENSAHGYTAHESDHYNSGWIPETKKGEPSESQEEDQLDLLNEILVDYKTWLDNPESGMRDYENFQAKQLDKFTITRK